MEKSYETNVKQWTTKYLKHSKTFTMASLYRQCNILNTTFNIQHSLFFRNKNIKSNLNALHRDVFWICQKSLMKLFYEIVRSYKVFEMFLNTPLFKMALIYVCVGLYCKIIVVKKKRKPDMCASHFADRILV